MYRTSITAAVAAVTLVGAGHALATTTDVFGTTGGVAILNAVAGQTYQVSATGIVDLAVGEGGYDVNPNGVIVDPIAVGSASYAFFSSFGNAVVGGSTIDPFSFSPDISPVPGAAYGVLTGEWSTGGGWFVIGASDKITAPTTGADLKHSVNDSSYPDNGGKFVVNVAAVPEPATWAMMLLGASGVGFALRFSRGKNGRLAAAR